MDFSYISLGDQYPNINSLFNSGMIGFDVETTGTHIYKSSHLGSSFAHRREDAYYVPCTHPFNMLLLDENKVKVAHNASFDRSMMKKAGITINKNLVCTQVAAQMVQNARMPSRIDANGQVSYDLGNSPLSLYVQSMKWNGFRVLRYSELGIDKRQNLATVDNDFLCEYSGPHSIATLLLWQRLEHELRMTGTYNAYMDIEMPFLPVISDIEYNGVMVDEKILIEIENTINAQLDVLESALDYYAGVSGMNHNSPDQVRWLLYEKLNLPKPKFSTKKGTKPSVDKGLIVDLIDKHPYISPYLKYKELMTLRNSYTTSLRNDICSDGRVYGKFNQTGTGTGRLSSSGPNLQKIPSRSTLGKLIRRAFVAPDGCVMVKVDWDQLELRMVAMVAGITGLVDAFKEGRDPHQETGDRMFKTLTDAKERRKKGKTKNFQMVYGGGSAEDKRLLDEAYPELNIWKKNYIDHCIETGCGYTLGGRKRVLPELKSSRKTIVDAGGREAVSTCIQGTSSEEVKKGMTRCWEKTKDSDVKMVLQVHDEAVFECPVNMLYDLLEVIHDTMPSFDTKVPLTVGIEIGDSWGNVKEVSFKG